MIKWSGFSMDWKPRRLCSCLGSQMQVDGMAVVPTVTLPHPQHVKAGFVCAEEALTFFEILQRERIWLELQPRGPWCHSKREGPASVLCGCRKKRPSWNSGYVLACLASFCRPCRQAWKRRKGFGFVWLSLVSQGSSFKNLTFYSWSTFSSHSP